MNSKFLDINYILAAVDTLKPTTYIFLLNSKLPS